MKVGFIGLGNVGGKLAGSLLRKKFDLTVRDLDQNLTFGLIDLLNQEQSFNSNLMSVDFFSISFEPMSS